MDIAVGRGGALVRHRGVVLKAGGYHKCDDGKDGHDGDHDAPANEQFVPLVLLKLRFPDFAGLLAGLCRAFCFGLAGFICGAH
jgi:hypothetical protein